MAINTDVWGEPWGNKWHSTAKSTRNYIWYYVINNNTPLNELPEPSAAYCAMHKDNYFTRARLFKSDKTSIPLFEQKENTYNWSFLQNQAQPIGDPYALQIWGSLYNRWANWDNANQLPSNYAEYTNTLLFNIKLNKLLFIPQVICSTTNTYGATTYNFTLAEYVATQHTNYPYIRGVFMAPYYNSGSDINPYWLAAWNAEYEWLMYAPFIEINEEARHQISLSIDVVSSLSIFSGTPNHKPYMPIMGFGWADYAIIDRNPVGIDPDESHYIYNANTNPTYMSYCVPYSEDFINIIYKQIAYFGVFFLAEGSGDFTTVSLLSDRVYCGTIESDGVTRGNYTKGIRNATQQQFLWDDTSQSPYNPSEKQDTWGDDFPNKLSATQKNLLNHWYLFEDRDIRYVMRSVNEVDLESLDKNYTFGMNPIDGILQSRRVFFNEDLATTHLSTFGADQIVIGELVMQLPAVQDPTSRQVHSQVIEYNYPYDFDAGSIDVIEPRTPYEMNDFRAYTPYSSAMFYDAFCGVVEISPSSIMNKTLKVIQTVDFLTGDKITSLYAKSFGESDTQYVRIATLHGNCAEEMPINGTAVAEYQRNKYLLAKQLTVGAIGLLGSTMSSAGNAITTSSRSVAAAENIVGSSLAQIGGFAASAAFSINELKHTIPAAVRVSNGSSNVESGVIYPPMLILYTPKMDENYDENEYKNLTGFAGYKVDTLENCGAGVHIVSHPILDIPCTSAEMYIILDQLQKGIIVKPE